ncbi:MAG: hypothetical protein ACJ8GW_16815 [Massilia sp.]
MSTCFLRTGFAALLMGACAGATSGVPDSFPHIDKARASHLLVVAQVSLGGKFPQWPECATGEVICIDPPPFWITLAVETTVSGQPAPTTLNAATTSHNGMDQFGSAGPYLIALVTDGVDYVMPRYQKEALVRNKAGNLYLPLLSEEKPYVLPCGVMVLREEIDASDFHPDLQIDKSDFKYHRVKTAPQLFIKHGNKAVPRYAIAIDRLQAFLERTPLEDVPTVCAAQAGPGSP